MGANPHHLRATQNCPRSKEKTCGADPRMVTLSHRGPAGPHYIPKEKNMTEFKPADNYSFVAMSGNSKTGFMPVTYSNSGTCPDACPYKAKYGESYRGCYADGGRVAIQWRKVDSGERGGTWEQLMGHIRTVPRGQVWRHNVAGDLAGENNHIDAEKLRELTNANVGRKGYTYCHKPLTAENAQAISEANAGGFTVNLSADSLMEADMKAEAGIGPVVVVIPSDSDDSPKFTPSGRTVVVCPAQTKAALSCTQCGLCANSKRKSVIGFKAHGVWEKQVSDRARVSLTVVQ